ncbi:tigger transposable element-derived protein 2-like [Bombus pascuorum]|uniref:tigger transposable element-derived protein 2-like n=1 Tax=Bombus pascuorum TaxID=65598 RepID=UPI00298D9C0C|nr:tigger transposable element-derived protein 2-like [Bombus pascuorum]
MRSIKNPTKLTIEKKNEILQKLESDQTPINAAIKYNISLNAVSEIYEQREEIINHFKIKGRPAQIQDIEGILYQWCIGCEKNNIKLTIAEIRRRAMEFNETLNGDPSFIASLNWAKSFMRRYNINQEDDDKILTPSKNSVNDFRIRFKQLLEEEDIIFPNVYNASYTPLLWKAVPERTWIFQNENNDCPQMYKDHVITFLCANVTGTHKLPVLIIGRNGKTVGSYNLNINASSTTYTGNDSDWVDINIFNMWFEKCFLKSIKEKEKNAKRIEKTLLLVNNAKWHYYLEDINKKYEFIRVITFPYNVAALIEPMECGIIECFRGMYRKELLETLMPLPNCNTQDNVAKNHYDLILWDCCRMIHNAWSNVNSAVMLKAWNQIVKTETRKCAKIVIAKNIARNAKEIFDLLMKLPGCQSCLKDHVKNWYQLDNLDTMVMKVYSDIVLRDFRKEITEKSKYTVDNEAGTSKKRANIV